MRRLILGTAGHIDHGKTALVRALTGVDTDRLPEEKRRGITIDLGFASLALGDGVELGIIDVPGHEAFIRNMLAGATGIDLVLLVVAADEGVMPQTREHLAIIQLLGVGEGIVALTKADLVEPEWLDLVQEEVRELLAGGSLAQAPIQPVSARTGQGLEQLTELLRDAAARARSRSDDDLFRMPVDRVFSVRGTGTVVTGTVWSGVLQRDGQVRIEPAGITARVRALQHHGAECDEIRAGERAAVALVGADRQQLDRGEALITGPEWTPASILTIDLAVLADAPAPLRPRQRVRVHLGTAEVLARLALPDGDVPPGGRAIAQLRLEQPILARALDRLVLRSYSPVHTIAGGVVLEPDAPKRKRLPESTRNALAAVLHPELQLQALLDLAGPDGVLRRRLPVVTGLSPAAAERLVEASEYRITGDRVVSGAVLDAQGDRILDRINRFHQEQPLADGIDRDLLRREAALAPVVFDAALQQLLGAGTLSARSGAFARSDHEPAPGPRDLALLDTLRHLFADSGLQAPDLQELPAEIASAPQLLPLLRLLERAGTLVRLTPSRWVDSAALHGAVSALYIQHKAGQQLGVSDFRDVLSLSRKHLIPLLEYLDRTGVTARTGDVRVLQPRSGEGGDAPLRSTRSGESGAVTAKS